jgi:urease accessory protein
MDLNTHWLLWQILDSGFPTGGFAHSSGLEAAWQHGEVPNRQELHGFAQASLWQAGRSQLPFVLATCRHPERLAEVDDLYHAFTSNHVANRASRAQGRALTTALQRVFPQTRELNSSPSQSPAPIGHPHFAPAFGAAMRRCGVEEPGAAGAFLFKHQRRQRA